MDDTAARRYPPPDAPDWRPEIWDPEALVRAAGRRFRSSVGLTARGALAINDGHLRGVRGSGFHLPIARERPHGRGDLLLGAEDGLLLNLNARAPARRCRVSITGLRSAHRPQCRSTSCSRCRHGGASEARRERLVRAADVGLRGCDHRGRPIRASASERAKVSNKFTKMTRHSIGRN